MGRQIHAQIRESNRPDEKRREFQGKELVTRKLKIKGSGKEFTGLIPRNAGVEKAIEMIAEQNGGEVKKKYYVEMGAHEITEISIGDQLITKDKTGGIHWFIDDNKIPVAVDGEGRIAFLNGEEVSVDSNEIISIGLESSTADPKTLKDLRGDRQKVESAHAASRDKEVDIEHSEIILFDKETGELTPMCACQEAESFDYGEISMEKIFVSQITAVENNPMPVFETDNKGFGEIFFSYIEIVDVKESILDRISFVSEPVEEMNRQEIISVEPAAGQTCTPHAESFSMPVTEMNYTSQADITTEVYTTPKRKEVLLPPPQYFQPPKAGKIKPAKKPKKKPELKLINYNPKIERIEKREVKKPEKYPPRIKIRKTEIAIHKIKYEKQEIKPKKTKTKTQRPKRKKKRRRAIEIVGKTASKIKKIKRKMQKLIEQRRLKRKKITREKENTGKKRRAGKKPKMKPEVKIKAKKITKTKKKKTTEKKNKPKQKKKKKIKNVFPKAVFKPKRNAVGSSL